MHEIDILPTPHDGFSGHVTPLCAYEYLSRVPDARLIDVRTRAEWQFTGVPQLPPSSSEVLFIEWQTYPDMAINSGFIALAATHLSVDAPVFLLCRSGVRSAAAAKALADEDFKAFNVAGGFEGALDSCHHRSTVSGWKHDGLTWKQT